MKPILDKPLHGARVLIVEDDAVLAFDLMCVLRNAGAETLGPAGNLKCAMALSQEEPLSCGILDVSLRDELVFPAAHKLRERGIGIVFYTGHADMDGLMREWPEAQVLSKPASSPSLMKAISAACRASGQRAPVPSRRSAAATLSAG
jgi:DNA-binding NtrC family response regulator